MIVPPDLEKLGHGWCLSQCQGFVRLFGTNSGGCINTSYMERINLTIRTLWCRVNHTMSLDRRGQTDAKNDATARSAVRSNTMNMKYKCFSTGVVFAGLKIAGMDLGCESWVVGCGS